MEMMNAIVAVIQFLGTPFCKSPRTSPNKPFTTTKHKLIHNKQQTVIFITVAFDVSFLNTTSLTPLCNFQPLHFAYSDIAETKKSDPNNSVPSSNKSK